MIHFRIDTKYRKSCCMVCQIIHDIISIMFLSKQFSLLQSNDLSEGYALDKCCQIDNEIYAPISSMIKL